jgi:putative tryptophan/tyrosine transport system substrate-binding protein
LISTASALSLIHRGDASSSRCSGGAASGWPLAARAQRGERMRRIGVFMPGTADDPVYHVGNASFLQALGESGWIVGRNVRIDYRWGAGDVERYRAIAADLVSLAPDAVLALGYATVSALQKATRSVPIVFVEVVDPVGGSLVASLARPGGNTTGFLLFEFGFSGKWLELLKEIAPMVTRVAVMRDSAIASQIGMFDRATFVKRRIDALIIGNDTFLSSRKGQIFILAAQHTIPTIYYEREFAVAGGLLSYGTALPKRAGPVL